MTYEIEIVGGGSTDPPPSRQNGLVGVQRRVMGVVSAALDLQNGDGRPRQVVIHLPGPRPTKEHHHSTQMAGARPAPRRRAKRPLQYSLRTVPAARRGETETETEKGPNFHGDH